MTLESILINLGIGIICTLLGYRLATSKQKHDDRTSIIRDVAEKYREFIEKNETSDLDGLVRSGIARLSNHDEIEDSIKLIESLVIRSIAFNKGEFRRKRPSRFYIYNSKKQY